MHTGVRVAFSRQSKPCKNWRVSCFRRSAMGFFFLYPQLMLLDLISLFGRRMEMRITHAFMRAQVFAFASGVCLLFFSSRTSPFSRLFDFSARMNSRAIFFFLGQPSRIVNVTFRLVWRRSSQDLGRFHFHRFLFFLFLSEGSLLWIWYNCNRKFYSDECDESLRVIVSCAVVIDCTVLRLTKDYLLRFSFLHDLDKFCLLFITKILYTLINN